MEESVKAANTVSLQKTKIAGSLKLFSQTVLYKYFALYLFYSFLKRVHFKKEDIIILCCYYCYVCIYHIHRIKFNKIAYSCWKQAEDTLLVS